MDGPHAARCCGIESYRGIRGCRVLGVIRVLGFRCFRGFGAQGLRFKKFCA